jgi:hypothetical protein
MALVAEGHWHAHRRLPVRVSGVELERAGTRARALLFAVLRQAAEDRGCASMVLIVCKEWRFTGTSAAL